jgi:UDP-3-O-[3-hydroxymyristoyl] N-acetylglucosamine deacetylase
MPALPGKDSTIVRRSSYRYQRTIAQPTEVQGTGYITGANVRLRFVPAPPSTGIVFQRTDLGPNACLLASADHVTGTNRRTTLGLPPLCVSLVEHVLAALAGLRIDNCTVELNAPEPPGLDGSALGFVRALHAAGTVLQPARRSIWAVEQTVLVTGKGATLAIHPPDSDELRISYLLDYGLTSPIVRQSHTAVVTPESFANELASCRTFLLEHEAHELRRHGIGSNTLVSDLLVFGPRGPIDNRLRCANEPARHKILDLVGDLALFGHDIRGHVVAYRSGHPHNVELVRELGSRLPQAPALSRMAA